MKLVDGSLRLAATDLANHLACPHLTTLDLQYAFGELAGYTNFDPLLDILRDRGRAHEEAYLAHLRTSGLTVESASAAAPPLTLMERGVDAIYQAWLEDGQWGGRADFLLRVDRPSARWAWSYEVADTKLGTDTRAGTVLQLLVYSDLLTRLQGSEPAYAHVIKPGPTFPRETFRVDEYDAIYRTIRRELEDHIGVRPASYPEPTPHCDVCNWRDKCDGERRRDDHLSLVANLGRLHQRELSRVGISRVTELAGVPAPWPYDPERGSKTTYAQLAHQARLQVAARALPLPPYDLLDIEPGRGLTGLPAPDAGDVFLDFEGDPFIGEGGREYLFGWIADGQYTGIWATDDATERAAFETLIDTLIARWGRSFGMHVYHFGDYEKAAIKRLAGRYGSRADEVDRLLRGHRLVDLLSITRQSMRIGVESYSIKYLEPLIGFARSVALADAGKSHRLLRLTLQRGLPALVDPQWRIDVEGYNRDDCAAAAALHDWLEARRSAVIAGGTPIARPPLENGERENVTELRTTAEAVAAALLADVPDDRGARTDDQQGTWLLGHLLEWYRRERKVAWWDFFRLAELSDDERLDEPRAIAGLALAQAARVDTPRRKNVLPVHRYRFPTQELYIRAGDELHVDAETKLGTIVDVDLDACTVDVKKTSDTVALHPASVFASKQITPAPKDGALVTLGQRVAEVGLPPAAAPSIARDLLLRLPPRGLPLFAGSLRRADESIRDCALRLALALDGTVLPIQGPPGTGKTATAAEMIVHLIRNGRRRVGVTATSHAVIDHLVRGAVAAARHQGVTVRALRKCDDDDDNPDDELEFTSSATEAEARVRDGEVDLLGATAWQWARSGMANSIDVLIIDEAGQMCLADGLAVSAACRSLVLVGDPQQLEQPIQGTHPDGTAVSVLQHMIGSAPTIPADRGLLLDRTHRLHPSICTFTSEQFYERRLLDGPDVGRQSIAIPPLPAPGLYWLPVEHLGNQNRSPEEAAVVAELVARCLAAGTSWTTSAGDTSPLTPDQILIVAPFNAHVGEIRDALDARGLAAVRAGTVDKFQGQQAAIAIYAMGTSLPADAPRGLGFLYDRHRLNVATSRARCASILVCSPALLRPDCQTPEHLHLASALARYVELSQRLAPTPA